MIDISDLHKTFDAKPVLDGVNLTVPHRRTLAILGRSGTGKSVLLKCLVGLVKPDRGNISIDGEEITYLHGKALDRLRQRIGFVFQGAALYDSMTVRGNLYFHIRRRRKISSKEMDGIVREKLRFVGLEDVIDKWPSELSGGMRKRVGLARAMVLEPDIMLYDEPTTGLDPITTAEIDRLIINLRDHYGVTSIAVTHNIESACRIADDIAVLYQGRIIIQGPFSYIEKSEDEFVQRFLKGLITSERE